METSRRTEGLLTILAAVVFVTVAAVFFSRFAVAAIVFGRIATALAAALLAAVAAVGWGVLAVRASRWVMIRAGAEDDGEGGLETTDELLIGAAVFGTVLAAVALVALSPLPILVVTVAGAAYAIAARRRGLFALMGTARAGSLAILLPPMAIALMAALAPVNTPDELVYKLAVPVTWLRFGRMIELPLNSNSYFPAAVYMADLAAMMWGAAGARLFHLLLYFAALRVVYRLTSRLQGGASLWPAAALAWTPALAIIAGWAWAEWAMIGLVLLSFLRFREFLDSNGATSLAVSACALGGALSAKYTALTWLAVFALLALWRMGRTAAGRRQLGAAVLVVVATGGFFYARNAAWTGSALAPFLLPGSPRIENFRSEAGGLRELARGYDIFHEGIIDDSLGIVLPAAVLLSPLALLARSPLVTDLFVMGAGQLAFLVPVAPTSRLMILGLVPLALLGAVAMHRLFASSGRVARMAMAATAAVALLGQLLLVAFIFVTSWRFLPYLVGAEGEDAYVRRTRDYHAAYTWIARNTSPHAKLLLLGENRTLHLERRAIAQGNLDGPRVAAWLSRFRSAEELETEMRRQGFTHVLVHKPWVRVDRPGTPPLRMMEKEFVLLLTPETSAVLRRYLALAGKPVYSDQAFILFEVKHDPPPPQKKSAGEIAGARGVTRSGERQTVTAASMPAAARMASALSVASQVNSGSVRRSAGGSLDESSKIGTSRLCREGTHVSLNHSSLGVRDGQFEAQRGR